MEKLTTSRGFWKAFFFSIITLGFYGWYLIHSFARETNIACSEDGKKTRGLLMYILLCICTLGIYDLVWHCKWITRCNNYLLVNNRQQGLQVSTYLLTVFLFGTLTLGIMFLVVYCKKLYLQNEVNKTYNELNNL